MTNKKCPHCGKPIPEESPYCMSCGKYVVTLSKTAYPKKAADKNRIIHTVLPVIAALIIIIGAAGLYAEHSISRAEAETAPKTTRAQLKKTTAKPPTATKKTTVLSTTEKTTAEKSTPTAATTALQTTAAPAVTAAPTTAATTAKKKTTEKKTTATTEKTTKPEIIYDGSVLKYYPDSLTAESFTVPEKVTKISKNAFKGNKHLKTLKFSSREDVECDWKNLFDSLKSLDTIYIYPGTTADLEGKQYFDGNIVYM